VAIPTFLALDVLHFYLRGKADDTGIPWQRSGIVDAERLLGWGEAPTQRLQDWLFAGHFGFLQWLAFIVYASWYVVPGLLTAYIVFWRRDLIVSYAFVRFGVAYAALIAFFLMPAEPPWMALHITRIFHMTQRAQDLDTNPVAALPSLHVALPAVQALWLRRKGMRRLSTLFGALSAGIGLAAVYAGEHYVVDCLAGGALAYAVNHVAARAENPAQAWTERRRAAPRAPDEAAGRGAVGVTMGL
jgi:membrane-associated phospholipid phosphatase